MKKYNIEKAIIYGQETAIELLKSRKLKEIITTDIKSFTDEKIFICDDKNLYGIVILNRPTRLDVEQFKSHSGRHYITDDLRLDVWGNAKVFNSHTFRIKKVFKEPIPFTSEKVSLNLGKFIDDVNIIYKENENVIKYKSILEEVKSKDSKDGKEELKKMFEDLYELFLDRYSEKYKNVKLEKVHV